MTWRLSLPSGRSLLSALFAALLVGTLGASSLRPASAAQQFRITAALRMQLPTMSTGKNQAFIVTGSSAQERNALIPLAGGKLAEMAGFTAIDPDAPQYATALKCM